MVLTWEKGYEDYNDKENWEPRYKELCRFAENVSVQLAQQLADDQLLDALEKLEELMRFYCVEGNMTALEPVMRKFNDLMSICQQRRISGVEVQYLEMLFLRVNAMLYRGHGQHKQGADCYDNCVKAAERCFETLKKAKHLSELQTFFVGWSCVECWKEAAEAHDAIMDAQGSMQILYEVVPMLEWLEKWLVDYPGICDQACELYAFSAGVFYPYGDSAAGAKCYQQAVRLFNALDASHGGDFYRARAIWVQCIHGTMAFFAAGDVNLMLQCEKEAAEYLAGRPGATLRDRTIVTSAQAIIDLQRSTALQQSGKPEQAIEIGKIAVAQLEVGLQIIQEDYEERHGYYRTVMSNIAARINNMCIGSKESLGVMYYQNDDPVAAEVTLKEVLEALNKTSGLHMTGSGAVLLQAEVLQYLGLIAADDGDGNQADFYGTQSADLAVSLGKESGNLNAWAVAAVSCSLVAETALAMKNKPKAAQYAEMGLSACDVLASANPDHPHLAIRSNLEKFKRKASRRFF